MNAWTVAAYAAGGAGSLLRYLVDAATKARVTAQLPLATIGINIVGSALLGLITGLVLFASAPSTLALIVGTGFCGGFTTFSTFALEATNLFGNGKSWYGAVYIALSLLLSVTAVYAGRSIVS